MMLRWISLVPPMIELARVASRPRAQRPPSTAPASSAREQRAGPEHGDRGLVEPLAHARPRTASRCSTPRRSPRRARAGRACARCAAGRSRRRSTTARAAGARAGRRASPRARARLASAARSRPRWSTCSFQTNDAPRSLASVVFATRQPSFSGPMRFSTGTSTSSRKTSLNSLLAGHLAQRPHVDARRVHRDREHRDALVRRARRDRCARARCPCRRTSRTTTTPSARSRGTTPPRFSARVERLARSLPGAGLAEQLAPDVVGAEDPRHPPGALLLGAVRHQRRARRA